MGALILRCEAREGAASKDEAGRAFDGQKWPPLALRGSLRSYLRMRGGEMVAQVYENIEYCGSSFGP